MNQSVNSTPREPAIFLLGLRESQRIAEGLSERGFRCVQGEATDLLHEFQALLVPLDLALVKRLHSAEPARPIIVVGQWEESAEAIAAVQCGAYDFLPEPVNADELAELLREAIPSQDEAAASFAVEGHHESDLIGRSRAMGRLYRDVAKLAATPVTVLVRGETGSGKELVARALWQHGHRAHAPLVVVNCAAIPENLLESELFGYERGAFTGATTLRKGKFEQANGATLFLDEIGDMSLPLQAKMLRVLQEKRIERVGGKGEIPVDVRLIAATHQPLEKMVEEGCFREDLYYRLQSATLTVPPLRDRLGDVELLTSHFLLKYGKEIGLGSGRVSHEALSLLVRQTWPGNVRQLQNIIRRAVLKRRELLIGREDIVSLLEKEDCKPAQSTTDLVKVAKQALDAIEEGGAGNALRVVITRAEEVVIREALKRSGGNQSKAARWLGITRLTLREKLRAMK